MCVLEQYLNEVFNYIHGQKKVKQHNDYLPNNKVNLFIKQT